MFGNLQFVSDDKKSAALSAEDFFREQTKDMDNAMDDPAFKNTPLVEIKEQALGIVEDLVPPLLEGTEDPEFLSTLEKIQNRIEIRDYLVPDLIVFLNGYRRFSVGRGNTFDKFVLGNSLSRKGSLFDAKGAIALLEEDLS